MEHRLFDKPFDVKKKAAAVVVAKEGNAASPDFNGLALGALAIFLVVVGVVMLMKLLQGVSVFRFRAGQRFRSVPGNKGKHKK